MNITQIAERLNEKAINEDFKIAALPELRKKYLGKKQLPSKIFTFHTIFKKDNFAFHHGGRDEMQFNLGEENIQDALVTRIALCFSLEPSPSLTDPVGDLEPFRKRFNKCIKKYPDYFDGFEMWYYRNNHRHGNFPSQIISDEWFQYRTFIAIGKTIKKPLTELNEIDLTEILIGFDNLLPIYQFCVLQSTTELSKEKRIAKVCWNENDWICPSGKFGKSNDPKSHERVRGFGHEEWLFDLDKLIDGYHYALLQPIQQGREKFLTKIFDVKLFSHNSTTQKNLWVGSIKNLEIISNKSAKSIYEHYKNNGWLDEMAYQIKSVKGDVVHFKKLKPHDRFNVRFKPEDVKLDKPYKKLKNFESTIGTYHYQFVRDKSQTPTFEKEKDKKRNFKFKPGKSEKSLANRVSTRSKKVVQSEPLHDKIQEILYDHLVENHGEKNVGMETDTGLGTRIDVSLKSNDGLTLYEVKSYPSVMITIRAALGQLFEYSYYPKPITNLNEMVIVSHLPIEEEDKEYLEFLRNKTSLKIYYQSVDPNRRIVSEKI